MKSKVSDARYRSFLDALDEACEYVTINDWEAEFISSNMDRTEFTPRQRESMDEMIERHGHKFSW